MSIPNFQSLVLPLLQLFADGHEHSLKYARDSLTDSLQLSEQELQIIPLGSYQKRFAQQIKWACQQLEQSQLLARTETGNYTITTKGEAMLERRSKRQQNGAIGKGMSGKKVTTNATFSKNNENATNDIAHHLASGYHQPRHDIAQTTPLQTSSSQGNVAVSSQVQTPQKLVTTHSQAMLERITSSYEQFTADLTLILLDVINSCNQTNYTNLIVDMLLAIGYGGLPRSKKINDHTTIIDNVIQDSSEGLKLVYVQAQRQQKAVKSADIQAFINDLRRQGADEGVFITSSEFSDAVLHYVERLPSPKLSLIDGPGLAALMIKYDIGMLEERSLVIRKPNLDYFFKDT